MRFQSARDLAFDLESLSSGSTPTMAVSALRVGRRAQSARSLLVVIPVVVLAFHVVAESAPLRISLRFEHRVQVLCCYFDLPR